jgi:hypothetical protein
LEITVPKLLGRPTSGHYLAAATDTYRLMMDKEAGEWAEDICGNLGFEWGE